MGFLPFCSMGYFLEIIFKRFVFIGRRFFIKGMRWAGDQMGRVEMGLFIIEYIKA